MNNPQQAQAEQLLTDAVEEIKSLRSVNQIQSARLGVFDDMMLLLKASPTYPSYGMSQDLVCKITKFKDSLQ